MKKTQLDTNRATKPTVEWKSDIWGNVSGAKTYNLPGFKQD